jgi:hypothetical protein
VVSRTAIRSRLELVMSTDTKRLRGLERIHDVVHEIRRANDGDDFALATKLIEYLGLLLGESPEKLVRTEELAAARFSAENKERTDKLAGDSLAEIQDKVFALGPSPSWH